MENEECGNACEKQEENEANIGFLKLQEYQRAKMPSLGSAAGELFDGAENK